MPPLDQGWDFLALDQGLIFSRYLPAITDRRFQPIGRRDLRALILIANPSGLNQFGLDNFDDAATLASLKTAFGDIPCDTLAASQ